MTQSSETAAMAFALLVLAFAFSVLAISHIDYRTAIVGPEGLSRSYRAEGLGGEDVPGGGQGNESSGMGQGLEVVTVQLSVTVYEETSQRMRLVRGTPVNVSTTTAEGEIQVAYGVTDRAGSVVFKLPPGSYSIFAEHFGVLGNFSATLLESNPESSMRWVFHDDLETPVIVQMNDINADGLISPDETIALFYREVGLKNPQRITMVVRQVCGSVEVCGEGDVSVDLAIVGFSVFTHGTYLVLSPLEPVSVSALGLNSTLLIGTVWYEVSITT